MWVQGLASGLLILVRITLQGEASELLIIGLSG